MRSKLKIALASTGTIVVVAFLVRIGVLFDLSYAAIRAGNAMAEGTPFASETGAIAAAIASGRGFSSPLRFMQTGPTAWLAPIYPYLLACVFKLFGIYSSASNVVAHTLNCTFSAFTAWPIAAIGTTVFGKRIGRASAWLWAVLPTSVFYSVFWIWDTALAGLWMALLVLATLKLRGSRRPWAWASYGALWAVGGMINPSLLAVLPFLAVWAMWPVGSTPSRAAKLAGAAALSFIVLLTPWTVRNYVVFHKLIPLRSNFGLELFLGIHADVPDGIRSPYHPNDNLREAQKYARMGEIAYMEEKQGEALTSIRESPANTAILLLLRLQENWLDLRDSPGEFWAESSAVDRLAMLGNVLFFAFCMYGVVAALRQKNKAAEPLGLVLLSYPIIFYITHASLRYRQPIDGMMLVFAVYGLSQVFARAAKTFASSEPVSASSSAIRANPQ